MELRSWSCALRVGRREARAWPVLELQVPVQDRVSGRVPQTIIQVLHLFDGSEIWHFQAANAPVIQARVCVITDEDNRLVPKESSQ